MFAKNVKKASKRKSVVNTNTNQFPKKISKCPPKKGKTVKPILKNVGDFTEIAFEKQRLPHFRTLKCSSGNVLISQEENTIDIDINCEKLLEKLSLNDNNETVFSNNEQNYMCSKIISKDESVKITSLGNELDISVQKQTILKNAGSGVKLLSNDSLKSLKSKTSNLSITETEDTIDFELVNVKDVILHVSIDGDDTFDGKTPDCPVKTIHKALEILNSINKYESGTIILGPGEFKLPENIDFNAVTIIGSLEMSSVKKGDLVKNTNKYIGNFIENDNGKLFQINNKYVVGQVKQGTLYIPAHKIPVESANINIFERKTSLIIPENSEWVGDQVLFENISFVPSTLQINNLKMYMNNCSFESESKSKIAFYHCLIGTPKVGIYCYNTIFKMINTIGLIQNSVFKNVEFKLNSSKINYQENIYIKSLIDMENAFSNINKSYFVNCMSPLIYNNSKGILNDNIIAHSNYSNTEAIKLTTSKITMNTNIIKNYITMLLIEDNSFTEVYNNSSDNVKVVIKSLDSSASVSNNIFSGSMYFINSTVNIICDKPLFTDIESLSTPIISIVNSKFNITGKELFKNVNINNTLIKSSKSEGSINNIILSGYVKRGIHLELSTVELNNVSNNETLDCNEDVLLIENSTVFLNELNIDTNVICITGLNSTLDFNKITVRGGDNYALDILNSKINSVDINLFNCGIRLVNTEFNFIDGNITECSKGISLINSKGFIENINIMNCEVSCIDAKSNSYLKATCINGEFSCQENIITSTNSTIYVERYTLLDYKQAIVLKDNSVFNAKRILTPKVDKAEGILYNNNSQATFENVIFYSVPDSFLFNNLYKGKLIMTDCQVNCNLQDQGVCCISLEKECDCTLTNVKLLNYSEYGILAEDSCNINVIDSIIQSQITNVLPISSIKAQNNCSVYIKQETENVAIGNNNGIGIDIINSKLTIKGDITITNNSIGVSLSQSSNGKISGCNIEKSSVIRDILYTGSGIVITDNSNLYIDDTRFNYNESNGITVSNASSLVGNNLTNDIGGECGNVGIALLYNSNAVVDKTTTLTGLTAGSDIHLGVIGMCSYPKNSGETKNDYLHNNNTKMTSQMCNITCKT